MTNHLSFELKRRDTLATLLLPPGFLAAVMALATLWTPSVQIESMKKVRSFVNQGRKV